MIPTPVLTTFRDAMKAVTPRWLQKSLGLAHKLLYSFALHLDLIGDAAIFGARRRFPGYDEYDSLALTGRDRKISRGRLEPDATYAARQLRWLDDHATRGNAYAMLAQVHAFYQSDPLEVNIADDTIATLIGRNGMAYRMYPDGSITRDLVVWDPDGSAPATWAHWWLGLQYGAVPTDGLWSDSGTWDDGGVWDYGLTPLEVAELRLIPKEWGNGHSIGHIVLLEENQTLQSMSTSTPYVTISVS